MERERRWVRGIGRGGGEEVREGAERFSYFEVSVLGEFVDYCTSLPANCVLVQCISNWLDRCGRF